MRKRARRFSCGPRLLLIASTCVIAMAARPPDARAQSRSRAFQQFRGATDSTSDEWEPRRPFYGGSLVASYAVPLSVTWIAVGGLLLASDGASPERERSTGAFIG